MSENDRQPQSFISTGESCDICLYEPKTNATAEQCKSIHSLEDGPLKDALENFDAITGDIKHICPNCKKTLTNKATSLLEQLALDLDNEIWELEY